MGGLAAYIMRGPMQAGGIVAAFGLFTLILPFFSYLSGAGVALVSLRKGPLYGFLVVAGATVFSTLVVAVSFRTAIPALVLLMTLWLPVWIFSWVLRYTSSQGLMLAFIGLIVVAFALGMRIWTGDVIAWWNNWLSMLVEQASSRRELNIDPAVVEQMAGLMNGLISAVMVVSAMITMLIGRWWQASLYNPGGFQGEFYNLRLPRLLLIPVGLAIVVLAMAGTGGNFVGVAGDFLFVAMSMYLFQGLAVAHSVVSRFGLSVAVLVIMYIVLLVLPPYLYYLLAAVGLADSLMNFRRVGKSGQGD